MARGLWHAVRAVLWAAAIGAVGLGAGACGDGGGNGGDAGPGLDRAPEDQGGGRNDAGNGGSSLTGSWAVKATLEVETMVLGTSQDATATLILRSEITESDSQVTLRTVPCDFQLPQLKGFESRLVVPPALLETVGEIVSEGTRSGQSLSGAQQVVTIGVVLDDPASSPLPELPKTPQLGVCDTADPGSYCDQEPDDKTGGTLLFEPPFNAGLLKLSKVYAAARTVVSLAGTISPDGNSMVGIIPAADIRLDTQVLGCEKCEVNNNKSCDSPQDCTLEDTMTVASFNPTATPLEGSEFLAVRLDEPLSCEEIVAQQGSLFR